jgi:hypothetical protein
MRSSLIRRALAASSVVLWMSQEAVACDVCALYTAVQVESPIKNAVRFGMAEQFTALDRIKQDGHYVENTANQFLKSSVTQISGQYDPSASTSLQLVVPVVSRTWRRIQDGSAQRGSDAGIGDITMLAHYVPVNYAEGNVLARLRVFGGVELPTGDAHYLGEESAPGHHGEEEDENSHSDEDSSEDSHSDDDTHHDSSEEESGHHSFTQKHNGEVHDAPVVNAIHGHDITLGSGSWDFPLGVGLFSQWDKYILASDVQYTIRTDGAFGYRFANDLTWSAAAGRYLYLEDDAQVALRARLSGQYKGYDTGTGGVEYRDTAFNDVFLGPEVTALVGHKWQAIVGYDLPVEIQNSDLQITPTYRIRAAISYRF